DAGPVAQLKTREPKAFTLKDVNRGTVYDGPLLVLVNGYSASASEMVAGTLQDYNRALIAGSPTYGKATGQEVLPMDTTIDPKTYDGHSQADSYIKLTTSRLYRVTGASAQVSGIKPNIELPEPTEAQQRREKDEKSALQPNRIDANKYYTPLAPLPIGAEQAVARNEMDSSAFFKAAIRYNELLKADEPQKDISLLMSDMLAEKKKLLPGTSAHDETSPSQPAPPFTVVNQAYEKQRLQADSDLKEINEEWRKHLVSDPYVRVAYRLVVAMVK
ncbi:MAG TPA: S41 family peptidase, partial [Chitinophagaceae bacterium]|nr:S41 family peptidase [Chitinophagaceae bacterium]